ncbi:unnamed protein product [Phytophthora fragariaefolia]|uniref:Unnamed protein product n=1 Tax=Phytophthora fragariaefolia TaxID=1490495 RepID=A0A9W6X7V3_9STRA|nr:unnamed protein product [Phytophthora fragariaefolia]
MAASSQGDEEDEERRALERELANELAALSAADVGFGEAVEYGNGQNGGPGSNPQIEMDYVRLDLNQVLQQVAKASSDELPIHDCEAGENAVINGAAQHSTWELLLQSVERIDREFFRPLQEDLIDIRTTILDVKASREIVQEDAREHPQILGESAERADHKVVDLCSHSEQTNVVEPEYMYDEKIPHQPKDIQEVQDHPSVGEEEIESNAVTERLVEPINEFESKQVNSEPGSAGHCVFTWSTPDPVVLEVLQTNKVVDSTIQSELDALAKQHVAREKRRLKLQARHQKERDDATELLRRLQEEFEAQEKNAEIARREAFERSAMEVEEARSREYAAAVREFQEAVLMSLADSASRVFASELDRMRAAIENEIAQMTIEDQAERLRTQLERQVQQQKEEMLTRCRFDAVLLELAKHHQVQRQNRDQQLKRERRECVQMRAEEAYTRRIIAETQVLYDIQIRELNRASMTQEDELARALQIREQTKAQEGLREQECCRYMEKEERRCHSAWIFIDTLKRMQKQDEERCQILMAIEEERCRRAWTYAAKVAQEESKERNRKREFERHRVLANVSAGLQGLGYIFQRHQFLNALEKWKRRHMQLLDEDRERFTAAENAAKRIQMWHRSCRRKQEHFISVDPPLILEDFSDDDEMLQVEDENGGNDNGDLDLEGHIDSEENQEAALRLQSTFRGFHVRRKFVNALALAQTVRGPEESDTFDAVDLDDLIQLPPELVDGWEDPVLPPSVIHSVGEHSLMQHTNYEEERSEQIDNNEEEDATRLQNHNRVKENVSNAPADNNAPKEQNLAATLWNKMKRAKQRQQQAQQERKRQQHPAYRVQKLLNRKPSAHQGTNQNGHGNQSSRSQLHTPQGTQKATNMVSWSSTCKTKKKPKVKVPSLVERLRRQTMAER